ncbi:MAG: metallophosphoesterase [Desulfuromonadales bacterium]|nr:metallophosphoesterase [Desulfuromonadales bacterium]
MRLVSCLKVTLVALVTALLLSGCGGSDSGSPAKTTTIFYTSDTHYGLKRVAFSGMSSAQQVNEAMIDEMDRLQQQGVKLPNDDGVNAGQSIVEVDFVAHTGDTINRSEGAVYPYKNAPAAAIWAQFQADYFTRLDVTDRSGKQAPLYLAPGNHEISDSIGYYKAGSVLDATAYANIYNLMMNPATSMTSASFIGSSAPIQFADTANYTAGMTTGGASYTTPANRTVTSRDVNGVHFLFVGMWPDAINRNLIDADLAKVSPTTPVVLFTHAPPEAEAKILTNPYTPPAAAFPVGTMSINSTNMFEAVISDVFIPPTSPAPTSVTPYSDPPTNSVEYQVLGNQRALVAWLKTHKNIVAWFNGHDNYNQFYDFTGPDNDISLPTFRVDSPMKGDISGLGTSTPDPTKLSFQVISIDAGAKHMTVREYLWDTKTWGVSRTISLAPRAN